MTPLPTDPARVGQREVVGYVVALDKCRTHFDESFRSEHTLILPAHCAACFPLQVFADMAVWKTWPR